MTVYEHGRLFATVGCDHGPSIRPIHDNAEKHCLADPCCDAGYVEYSIGPTAASTATGARCVGSITFHS